MIIVVLVLVPIAAIAAWWLSRQGLATEPWLNEGASGEILSRGAPERIGLGVFLAVVASLFMLLAAAYLMRMDAPDWRPLPAPQILWFNTGVLIVSSLALQYAASRAELRRLGLGLMAAGIFALAFLLGQLVAWRQLSVAGYFAATNPANAFFYLLTGLHGLHLIGGLAALARTADKAWRRLDWNAARQGAKLCAIYWHFMLLVWIILFALLTGWGDNFAVICRKLLA